MTYNGYQSNFIDVSNERLVVNFPELNTDQIEDLAPVGDEEGILNYIHYSLKLSRSRRFPFFTATNINGEKFIKVKRAEVFPSGRDEWSEDERAGEYQWNQKLYDAPKSYFDRGHMAKREDPQWGSNIEFAKKAARSTFHFTNCIPQVAELNQRIWASLENYILSKQTVPEKLRICLFTGPVLSGNDPDFVTEVDGFKIQLPVLFWKVVYFSNDAKVLSRVAFIMGQEDLLVERGIVEPRLSTRTLAAHFAETPNYFMDYEDAETYQVTVATIEKLTGLTFQKALDPFKKTRPVKLIKEAVQATGNKLAVNAELNLHLLVPDFTISNITL